MVLFHTPKTHIIANKRKKKRLSIYLQTSSIFKAPSEECGLVDLEQLEIDCINIYFTIYLYTIYFQMTVQCYLPCICVLMIVATTMAFPRFNPQTTTRQDKITYCDSLALQTVLKNLELPLEQSNFRSPPEDITLEDGLPMYDASAKLNLIKTARELLETLETSLFTSQTQGIRTFQYNIFKEYNKIRDTCLSQYTIKNQYPDVSVSGNRAEDRSLSEDLNAGLFKRGNQQGLTLNPTGWRKRRETSKKSDEDYEDFVVNVRQLLDKRRRRLQFNPTGW